MASNWLGAFGEQWFGAICLAARCDPRKATVDVTGDDYTVHDPSSEIIRVQIKTTEHPSWSNGALSYPIDVSTYNKLRTGSTPGYLVVLVAHRPLEDVTRHLHIATIVRVAAYWFCLQGMPPTPNTATVTVSLPRGNILTPAQLTGLFPREEVSIDG